MGFLTENLQAIGDATFSGSTLITGASTVGGTLDVNSDVNFYAGFSVASGSAVSMGSDLTIEAGADLIVNRNLTFGNNAAITLPSGSVMSGTITGTTGIMTIYNGLITQDTTLTTFSGAAGTSGTDGAAGSSGSSGTSGTNGSGGGGIASAPNGAILFNDNGAISGVGYLTYDPVADGGHGKMTGPDQLAGGYRSTSVDRGGLAWGVDCYANYGAVVLGNNCKSNGVGHTYMMGVGLQDYNTYYTTYLGSNNSTSPARTMTWGAGYSGITVAIGSGRADFGGGAVKSNGIEIYAGGDVIINPTRLGRLIVPDQANGTDWYEIKVVSGVLSCAKLTDM